MLDDVPMMIDASRRWLLIFALFMRVIVPSGFMLDAAVAAHPTLVACDGRGPIFSQPSDTSAHHHGHHGHQGNHGGGGQHGECPHSAASGAADRLTDAPGLAAFVQPMRPLAIIKADRPYRPVAAALPPPSTGPPSVALSLDLID